MRKRLYKIKYYQRFKGSSQWNEYEETLTAKDGQHAVEKLVKITLNQELGGDDCTGVDVTHLEIIGEITL